MKQIMHTQPLWDEQTAVFIKAGSNNLRLGFFKEAPRVACRVLAEENFQFAKHRINCHDDLVSFVEDILETLKDAQFEKTRNAILGIIKDGELALIKARGIK